MIQSSIFLYFFSSRVPVALTRTNVEESLNEKPELDFLTEKYMGEEVLWGHEETARKLFTFH